MDDTMYNLIQMGFIFGGPLLWVITKNKRWMFLTLAGVAWFAIDVLLIARSMMP